MSSSLGLPPGWALVALAEMAAIRDDLRQPVNADERSKRVGPYPYYGATGQVGWIDDFRLDGTYVLLGEDGAPFLDPVKPKAYIIQGKSWVNNHAHVLQAIEGISENRFIMYALNAFNYAGVVNGTTRLKLTQGAMRQMMLPLPPLAEQRRIVAAIEEQFTRLDAGVAALKSARARLKQYRAAVLKAAVEGELTKAWREAHPDTEPASELLARILAERQIDSKARRDGQPESQEELVLFDQSWLPKNWCWTTLVSLVSFVTSGSRGWAQYYSDKGAKFIRIGNLDRESISLDLRDIQLVMPPTGAEGTRTKVQPGDVLISITAELGLVGLVPTDIGEAYINQHVALTRPVDYQTSSYLAWFLASAHGYKELDRNRRGATKAGLGLDDIRAVRVPLPPLTEQDILVSEIEGRLSVITTLEASIAEGLQRAERLRQSILTEAFSGRLVPQDLDDEPASALLDKVARSKQSKPSQMSLVGVATAGNVPGKARARRGRSR